VTYPVRVRVKDHRACAGGGGGGEETADSKNVNLKVP
jgi:hypothetical protein